MADVRQLNIRVSTDLAERLRAMAQAQGLSLNQLLVAVLSAAADGSAAAPTLSQRVSALEERVAKLEESDG